MLRRTILKGIGAALVSANFFLMPESLLKPGRVVFYDPKDVVIMFDGVEIKGFADGGFINIENPWKASPDERVRTAHLHLDAAEWFADSRLGVPYRQLKFKGKK